MQIFAMMIMMLESGGCGPERTFQKKTLLDK